MTITHPSNMIELGLPEGPLDGEGEADPFVSKIGGKPTWLWRPQEFVDTLKCQHCHSCLYLLLQMDCPLPASMHPTAMDRVIYVFACNSRLCTESTLPGAIKVLLQCQRPKTNAIPSETSKVNKPALWDSIFGVEEVKGKMEDLNVCREDHLERPTLQDSFYDREYPVAFPATSLYITEERLTGMAISKEGKSTSIPNNVPSPLHPVEGEEQWIGEHYEKMSVAGYDAIFKAFHRRVASYPRQCVRFNPGGTPLFFSSSSTLPEGACCGQCGKPYQFELQLMPAILSLLPTNRPEHLRHIPKDRRNTHPLFGDGMEWGTILVYTCGVCHLRGDGRSTSEGYAIVHVESEQ